MRGCAAALFTAPRVHVHTYRVRAYVSDRYATDRDTWQKTVTLSRAEDLAHAECAALMKLTAPTKR